MMEPWMMYGQTLIGAGQLHIDPVPTNRSEVRGTVAAFPYTVPEGKRLLITSYGVEGNAVGNTIFPFLGNLPVEAVPGADQGTYQPWWDKIAAAALYSVAGSHQKFEAGFQFELEPGSEVHVGLINSSPYNLVHAWLLQGYLVDAVDE